ncbi:MAG: sulfoxide reductase heme-binding subunit YedZ [Gammaproteobacteria bacterium]|nr:sulfoxide reductase heme-binding subunit YedZ [Gammaproteobacteria bacterium]
MLFVLALVPLAFLIHRALGNDLGANPIETINRFTGDWVLRFLMITLTVTPLRRLMGWNGLLRYRRMFGLFAFFYACLHFLSYAWLDQYFVLADIIKDVAKRPYITVGFASFLMLIPLAVTSTNAMIRWLGAQRWQQLHRLVYAIGIGGVVHFLWLVKSDIREPLVYGVILALLLGFRLWSRARRAPIAVASGGIR